MRILYLLLSAAQMMMWSESAFAQASAALPKPVQTIALQPHQAMCGAVQLPNHQTVIFLADLHKSQILMQSIAPDGSTTWQTNVARRQQLTRREEFDLTKLMADLGSTGSKQKLAMDALEVATRLKPLEVFTSGNQVFAVEQLSEEAYRGLPKTEAKRYEVGQIWVQRLTEAGQLTEVVFHPRPAPASKKVDVTVLARFVDENAYHELVRESNEREGSVTYFTDRYDILTRQHSRQPLSLPATPPKPGMMSGLELWYRDWAYLGHRPNQTYLFRRSLTTEPKQKPGRQPLTYEVLVLDNKGVASGGFKTTLNLPTGTGPAWSGGTMGGLVEQDHGRQAINTGSSAAPMYLDTWSMSAGGFGDFYLDYATGDVLVYGEFSKKALPEIATKGVVDGFFMQRYSSNGQMLKQLQYPYTAAMEKANKGDFETRYFRPVTFFLEPLREQYNFSFRQANLMSLGGRFDLFINGDLSQLRYRFEGTGQSDYMKNPPTEIIYPGPVWLAKSSGLTAERRIYSKAEADDAPVYASLLKLNTKAAAKLTGGYQLYLTSTGGGKSLVIERPQLVGGNVRVFTF